MRSGTRRVVLVAVTAVLCAGAAMLVSVAASRGSSRGASAGPPALDHNKNTLVIAVDAVNTDFDPASAYTSANINGMWPIYQGLTRLAGSSVNRAAPELATSWTHSADLKTWTFKLRKGVTFSDGTPFDAQAVKTNYVRTVTLNLGAQFDLVTFLPKPAKQIVVVNASTVRFDLLHPYRWFPLVMADQYGMLLVSPSVFKQHSTGQKDQGSAYLKTHAVGTGPYMIKSFQPGSQVVLVRNPHYWGGWSGPHFQQVIFRAVPDAGARTNLFLGGGADATYLLPPQTTASVRDGDSWARVSTAPDAQVDFITLGVYGPLKSPAARQAMNYAFDYHGFVAGVMKNTVRPAQGVLPTQLLGHDPSIHSFTTDLQKAKALFAKAGVTSSTKLTYEYSPGYGKQAGEVMQAQLGQIGIHLQLVPKSYSAFLADFYNDSLPTSQRASMYGWAYWPDYNDPSVYAIPNFTPAGFAAGNERYDNPTVTRLINAAAATSNVAKIKANYKIAQHILAYTDPVWVPVDQSEDGTIFRCDVAGWAPNPYYIRSIDPYLLHRTAGC
jgi:peptide/nickel transport system substrate-binding protein